jgi:predicted DNA-binding transcriptional regulator YafY
MSNRNSSAIRILSLLRLLEQRRRWTLHELAERFKVTTRTVRRDLEVLQSAEYPIGHANLGDSIGKEGLWWLL